jgi:hypothetical protein
LNGTDLLFSLYSNFLSCGMCVPFLKVLVRIGTHRVEWDSDIAGMRQLASSDATSQTSANLDRVGTGSACWHSKGLPKPPL